MVNVAPLTRASVDDWLPPPLENPTATGLTHGFLADLALKIMYFRGQITGNEIAQELKLPFQSVVHPVLSFLKRPLGRVVHIFRNYYSHH